MTAFDQPLLVRGLRGKWLTVTGPTKLGKVRVLLDDGKTFNADIKALHRVDIHGLMKDG